MRGSLHYIEQLLQEYLFIYTLAVSCFMLALAATITTSTSNNATRSMILYINDGDSYCKLKADTLKRWSRCEAATKARLLEASRIGDRLAIIEAVHQVLPEFEVQECFEGKNEPVALKLLESGKDLSDALALAPASCKLFGRILSQRIRQSYNSGEVARCSHDCRFAEQQKPEDDDDKRAFIETLVLHANCCKVSGEPQLARNLLNEAMRRINELCNNDSSMKAQMLQSLLTTKPTTVRSSNEVHRRISPPSFGQIEDTTGTTTVPRDWCNPNVLGLSRDRTRGRFLYAKRNIKPGSVLIVDRPFSFSTDIPALRTNCTNCHLSLRLADVIQIPCEHCSTIRYCSEECRQSAWDEFHKYECSIFKYFYEIDLQRCNAVMAYRTIVAASLRVDNNTGLITIDQDFLRLHENTKNSVNADDDVMSIEKYDPSNYETVFSLATHSSDQTPRENLENAFRSIFLTKCLVYSLRKLGFDLSDYSTESGRKFECIVAAGFLHSIQAIKCNAYEIVENVRNDETKILEPRNFGGAIYPSVSLSNHSCYPNVVRHTFPNGIVVVTSLRFIEQGEEILDCYGQHFLENDRDYRRRQLKLKYCFECKCEACSHDWPSKLESHFKIKQCSNEQCRNATECKQSAHSKLYNWLRSSIEKKRITALTKMYDGCYSDALPLLLEHANGIGKILSEPSLEAVKTQQSIIQCLNAMSSMSV